MGKTSYFYGTMIVVLVGLFLNASIESMKVQGREEAMRTEEYPTLTYDQCAEEFFKLQKDFGIRPKSPSEYYAVLGRAYGLMGSARKAMAHDEVPEKYYGGDFRKGSIIRGIPVSVQQSITEYDRYMEPFAGSKEQWAALAEFDKTTNNPLRGSPKGPIPGSERLLFLWLLFHVGAFPFIFIHFAIRLREKGLSVWMEVCANPAFPLWLIFWEVGLFRYPKDISAFEQLRRAQRWATLVLSSALSCFGATGASLCKPKRQHAPQEQVYDRPLEFFKGLVVNTSTLSNYVGGDGFVFHPAGVQQTSVTALLPCGFYLNGWNSEPIGLRGLNPNFGREFDYAIGRSFTERGVSFDLSATYVNVSPQSQMPRGDVLQLQEIAARKFALPYVGVRPYLMLRQEAPTKGGKPLSGQFVFLGTQFTRPVGKANLSVDVSAVRDFGVFGFNPGWIGKVSTDVGWKMRKGVVLHLPIVNFNDPLTHVGDGRKPTFTFGMGLSFSAVR